ncbi:MAG TPA: hypothetical protein VFV98_06015 [Vicinamibacterales bacterium]|nr:hypothetical protein [Vicinamibacterales bacterium]
MRRLPAAAAVILVATIAVRAQQGPPQGGGAAARPLVPAAASSIAQMPETFYGENVSMSAAVEALLSKTTFTVDQNKMTSTGKDVLVIAPNLQTAPALNAYITVVGEVFKFSPEEVARRNKTYTLDLSPELIEKFKGKPAVMATSVVDMALTDLAKKPIPPPTPAELALSATMKGVQTASTALRTSADGSDLAGVKAQADILKKAFTDTQAFFKTRNTADAIGWAGDALKMVTDAELAAAAGKWDDAKSNATGLTKLCATCHAAHRERMEDGTFRVKG